MADLLYYGCGRHRQLTWRDDSLLEESPTAGDSPPKTAAHPLPILIYLSFARSPFIDVYTDNTKTHTTDVEVLDAQKVDAPPLCVARMPWHTGSSFHGVFHPKTFV